MGGSRGGGFSGGSRGGGFSGGGFGGGMHHGPRGPHHHHGPHYHRPRPFIFFGPRFHRPRYYGGGCAGSAFIFFALIMLAIFFIVYLVAMPSGNGATFDPNSDIIYSESTFQAYANDQYFKAFSETESYEENILIVFTVYEGYDGYECIPWGGNEIDEEVSMLFGDYFRSVTKNAIPSYYEYALPTGFRSIVNTMKGKVSALVEKPTGNVDTSFSKLYNNSALTIDSTVVDKALREFTEETGINIAIVVEEGEDIFESSKGDGKAVLIIILIVVTAIIVIAIVNKNKGGNGGASTSKSDPEAGQGKYDPNTGEWK